MPGGEVMGERIPSESYGNVYSMMKDFPSLSGSIFRIPTVAKVNVGRGHKLARKHERRGPLV